jgi:hypothetical protein
MSQAVNVSEDFDDPAHASDCLMILEKRIYGK